MEEESLPVLRDKNSTGWQESEGGSVKEAKMMAVMHSNGSLAVLAPVNLNEKGTEISVLVQDRNGCMQSGQPYPRPLGDTPVINQSTAPQRGNVGDGGTKQIVLNFNKRRTEKQGWEAELAPGCCGETMVTTSYKCGGTRRASTNSRGWTRGDAGGGPGDQFDLRGAHYVPVG